MAKRVRVNKKNLRKLISAIENGDVFYKNQKVYFDMGLWFQENDFFMESPGDAMNNETGAATLESDGLYVLKDCGSAACIGSHIELILSEKESIKSFSWEGVLEEKERILYGDYLLKRRYVEFLGISIKKVGALLIPWAERENQLNSFVIDDFENVKREHAVKVLNNLLETGEVDWSVIGLEFLKDYEAV